MQQEIPENQVPVLVLTQDGGHAGIFSRGDAQELEQHVLAYKFVVQIVFQEAGFMDIVEGTIDESNRSDSEREEKFNKNQTKIMRLIGTTVRDKITGTEIWEALYDLFEQEQLTAHTIHRLRDDIWIIKFAPGGNINLHLSKMFNIRTELQILQYVVDDIDMVKKLLESLPSQAEFESQK
ncbi:LOW QUALITY PROTEIN: Multidrug resistance protein ABC Superfamily [Phytophthora palmivora]|uniref:Multidrug resistance protein ABC Superfamily n=1 Tax=Phytophthora palmivora TaxID=4796 RepID=A0A2P4WZX8_9STRA|nr:LOW QUALITY PROTEIN: Multidrug resistance protein ABC Superfamily [Phytophthora palmivora]